jgi:mono/diheme cytochrome c family protein
LLSYFERVREFVRKPDIIAGYMYCNGLRAVDYPLYAEEGLLPQAIYGEVRTITPQNRLACGQEVFRIACTRCHTTTGNNGVVAKLARLYGQQAWQSESIQAYLASMHNSRPFMPPLPGNEEERAALADYLIALRDAGVPLSGAQSVGVMTPSPSAITE